MGNDMYMYIIDPHCLQSTCLQSTCSVCTVHFLYLYNHGICVHVAACACAMQVHVIV